ncbi:helix-turn-helix transcriptional regulator [Paenibacillus larvae]
MGIRENIKKLRSRHGLTQQDLADIAGVTNKAVSAWESGLAEPRMGAIEKIAARFGLKKSNIIEENGMDLPLTKVDKLNESSAQEFLRKYNSLDEKGKHTVNTVLNIEYSRCIELSLEPIAAHNDDSSEEQIKLMQQDLDDL